MQFFIGNVLEGRSVWRVPDAGRALYRPCYREGALKTLYNTALTLGVPARELPLGLNHLYLRPQE